MILHQNDTCDADTCTDPNDQGARPAGTISFSFSRTVYIDSLDFFDIEGPEIGDVVLFGPGGIVLNTLEIPDTGGDNQWARLLIGIDGVIAMDVNMGGSGAIDNLEYTVPLPAGLPLLLGALGALGLTWRRKT